MKVIYNYTYAYVTLGKKNEIFVGTTYLNVPKAYLQQKQHGKVLYLKCTSLHV